MRQAPSFEDGEAAAQYYDHACLRGSIRKPRCLVRSVLLPVPCGSARECRPGACFGYQRGSEYEVAEPSSRASPELR